MLSLKGFASFFILYQFFAGRCLHLSIDGFLLGKWYVDTVGVFLSNDCYIMDIWYPKVLQLRSSNDGNSTQLVLVHMLACLCSGHHGCTYKFGINKKT